MKKLFLGFVGVMMATSAFAMTGAITSANTQNMGVVSRVDALRYVPTRVIPAKKYDKVAVERNTELDVNAVAKVSTETPGVETAVETGHSTVAVQSAEI
ncbi:MAG: hypothetical protein K6B71_04000 [Alphaproteobacteria bacterium]|nr:hypothetical protein [Alphaproteobacteria bacterium]